MNKNTLNDVNDVIQTVEQVYINSASNLNKKLDNIKRINIETLTELVEKETENGHIKEKKDIVKYIEQIIQD